MIEARTKFLNSKIENVKYFAGGNFLIFSSAVLLSRFYEGNLVFFWVSACSSVFGSLLASGYYALYLNELFLRRTNLLLLEAYPKSQAVKKSPQKASLPLVLLFGPRYLDSYLLKNHDDFEKEESAHQVRCMRMQILGVVSFVVAIGLFLQAEYLISVERSAASDSQHVEDPLSSDNSDEGTTEP